MSLFLRFNCTIPQVQNVFAKQLIANTQRCYSVYGLFLKDTYPNLKKEHPYASFGEVSKMAANKWTMLTDTEKRHYQEQAAKLRTENSEKRAKRPRKTSVKRPPSGYILFSNELRTQIKEQNPSMSPQEIVKLLSEKWNALSNTAKAKYNQMSKDQLELWKTLNA
ncbi:HBR223Cp [Eremothecium sinecaudum]|uniref:HBR223Cp n=1 Tax=Eremothecium sinecaudum TaxID=45286 RepID=A0A120K185_9SACH|nr:HBR223Cp [Eremothecium sinecaudum]AMD19124.1 HBR223Cp [Eremothecium sinecaudum]